jgi:hypothetical protein
LREPEADEHPISQQAKMEKVSAPLIKRLQVKRGESRGDKPACFFLHFGSLSKCENHGNFEWPQADTYVRRDE